jgi:hypothetical protein
MYEQFSKYKLAFLILSVLYPSGATRIIKLSFKLSMYDYQQ